MFSVFRPDFWQAWPHGAKTLLLLAAALLLASFETAFFSLKRPAADGHVFAYMAQQFLAEPTSFFSYTPPPGHSYMPEVFICAIILFLAPQLAAWQVIGIANIVMSLAFVWLLSVFLPNSLAAHSQTRARPHDDPFVRKIKIAPLTSRICMACTLLAFLNFANATRDSFFGLDATNAHMGAYVTSLLLVGLILGTHKPATRIALIMFCALGLFSSKLVLASAVAPLLLMIFIDILWRRSVTAKDLQNAALLFAFSCFAFAPNFLLSGLETVQRTSLSLSHVLPTLHIWMDFGRAQITQFGPSQFIYAIMMGALLVHALRHYRHPMSLLIIASLLVCFFASLATGSFRGWNLRYFGGGLFLAAGFLIAAQSAFTRPIWAGLSALTIMLAVQNTYDFSYPETREQKLAACLKPLLADGSIKRGMAGHWDSAPVNHFLGKRCLIKTTLRGGKPEPYQWMVDTAQNHFDQKIDFALENKANGFYKLSGDNLKMLPGHKGTVKCPTGDTIIHLYDAKLLGAALTNRP